MAGGSSSSSSRGVSATASAVFEAKAHTGMVNAIDGCGGMGIGGGAPEILTGGRDGCVRVSGVRLSPRCSLHDQCAMNMMIVDR